MTQIINPEKKTLEIAHIRYLIIGGPESGDHLTGERATALIEQVKTRSKQRKLSNG